MHSSSPLIALPIELRTIIFRHLLCPHDTINIHRDWDWFLEIDRKSEETRSKNLENGGDKDSDENQDMNMNKDKVEADEEYRNQLYSVRGLRSRSALPVSILRVNHQLYHECFSILYPNTLYFDVDTRSALNFLYLRRACDRAHIRHLGFDREATAADDRNVTDFWGEMHDYIATELQIETVTIWVPDTSRGDYTSIDDSDWFWSPAVDGLVRLLLNGSIESVRLLLANKCSNHKKDGFVTIDREPVTLPEDEVLEELEMVRDVTYTKLTQAERDAIWKYRWRRGIWDRNVAYEMEFKKKRRLPLKIEREDKIRENEGSVIVLKRDRRIVGRIVY